MSSRQMRAGFLLVAILAIAAALLFPRPNQAKLLGEGEGDLTTLCGTLFLQHDLAVRKKDYFTASKISQQLKEKNCLLRTAGANNTSLPAVCKAGIKHIDTFLKTCPTDDPAFFKLNQDFAINVEGQAVSSATLIADVKMVCANIKDASKPAPTLNQRAEHLVMQSMRTMYTMDNHGETGCPYPWTGGKSLYSWMKKLSINTIDIRANVLSQCCTANGSNYTFTFAQPAANQYPVSLDWPYITGRIALIIHEARHAPTNNTPPAGNAFLHSTCCPLHSPAATSGDCDDKYDLTNLSPYAVQYWLFAAWLNGTINVGYGCLPQVRKNEASQFLLVNANGYPGRFCTTPPPNLTVPSNAGGICPTP